jgi:hypothetical protein
VSKKKEKNHLVIVDVDTYEDVLDDLNLIEEALPVGCEEHVAVNRLMDLFCGDDLLKVHFSVK